MDSDRAEALSKRLAGSELDGWVVERYISHGKSAAVFLARRADQLAAVKVFDTELIERYGDRCQLERINRELQLRGQKHENLVSIYGGGYDETKNLYFVVMEFLDGPNLRDALLTVSSDQIPKLIRQLASAARFLEERQLVHRDIKPENIVLLEEGRRLVLLDLGVIRPISGSNLTDPEGVQAFVGTLQYSSPEFLLREEEQTLNGWRALTYYQIGAVLHDLIMKRPLFEKFANPYAKLVNAVQFEQPAIINPEVPSQLIDLARNCLLKNARNRLSLLSWESFEISDSVKAISARERVAERLATLRAQSDETGRVVEKPAPDIRRMQKNLIEGLSVAARHSRGSVPNLPPLHERGCDGGRCVEFRFDAVAKTGFPHGLVIQACIEVIDPVENVIACSGSAFFPGGHAEMPSPGDSAGIWFKGVVDNIALNSAFEQFFFRAVEWCLQISPGVDAKCTEVFRPS